MITQYSQIPFEVFTIDGLFSDTELNMFKNFIDKADSSEKPFTSSPFKNGKVYYPEWTNLIYSRLSIPNSYTDANNIKWIYKKPVNYIFYSYIQEKQLFGIHTDTGSEYDRENNKYSKFTMLIYLNDNYTGGTTTFYDLNFKKRFSIQPKRNRALIFDIDLYHCGDQVQNGEKYWIGTEIVCGIS